MPKQRYTTYQTLSNWLRGYDRYTGVYSKENIPLSTYPDRFFLFSGNQRHSAGIAKAERLIQKLGIPGDRTVVITTILPEEEVFPNNHTGTGIGSMSMKPGIPLEKCGWLETNGSVTWTDPEEITAEAFALATKDTSFKPWKDCLPRTFSVLPISRACQAKCKFCFSKASVSNENRNSEIDLSIIRKWARHAASKGATRSVITGGGEPTLLKPETLREIIRILAGETGKTNLITNGAIYSRMSPEEREDTLGQLHACGLDTLVISRHGQTEEDNSLIMGIPTNSWKVMLSASKAAPGMRRRYICVIQKGGVDSPAKVRAYIKEATSHGVSEVCFKELYVSALKENKWGANPENDYSRIHRIPLSMIMETLEKTGFQKEAELPWGSPVYTKTTEAAPTLRVAAYTEPSVGWERSNGIVRSWNLLSDNTCLASLEDSESRVHFI